MSGEHQGYQPQSSPPPAPGGPPSQVARPPYGPAQADNTPAVLALVLGIVGVVMLPPAAPFAWWQGVVGKRKVDAGETTQNRGMAVAGQVLGIIGTVLLAIYVLIFVIVIIAAIAAAGAT